MKTEKSKSLPSIAAGKLGKVIADVTNRVAYGGETIVITKFGRPVAELRPIEPVGKAHAK